MSIIEKAINKLEKEVGNNIKKNSRSANRTVRTGFDKKMEAEESFTPAAHNAYRSENTNDFCRWHSIIIPISSQVLFR